MANILELIANPRVGDMAGAAGRGLQQGSATQANFQRSNLLRQQAAQEQQRFTEVSDQNQLIELANDFNTALSLGPGENQTKILKSILTKAPSGSAIQVVANDILSTPNPEEQQKKIEDTVNLSIQKGYLKPMPKATKTPEQIEREVAEKEKTPTIKEFEYAQKNPKFALQQMDKKNAEQIRETAGKSFKNAMDLRKEFTSQSADFQKVRDAYTRVKGSTENPSPAGDLSLIFNYMKMLDPGSVVRESEFATAASAGSYGERIKAAVQKVASGERLSPKMRADFLSKSGTLMKGIEAQHKKREKSYREIAKRNKLDPQEVVIDLTVPVEEQQAGEQDLTQPNDPLGIR